MTLKDRIKATCDYFGFEYPSLSDFDIQKMESIWKVETEIKEVPVISFKLIEDNYEPVDLIKELERACDLYNVKFSEVVGKHGKEGRTDITNARTYFARYVKIKNPKITTTQLKTILNKHHTSILHYWYSAKADVSIPPLPKPNKKQIATIDKLKRQMKKA